MTTQPRRNVAPVIKATLRKINPSWKVSVHSGTGTAWGWVTITIDTGVPRPKGMDTYEVIEYRKRAVAAERYITPRIVQALKASGEQNRIFSYTDDMGSSHSEMFIEFI